MYRLGRTALPAVRRTTRALRRVSPATRRAALPIGVAVSLILGMNGASSAQPATSAQPAAVADRSAKAPVVSAPNRLPNGEIIDTEQEEQQLRAFWTPERMEAAISADAADGPSGDAEGATGDAGAVGGQGPVDMGAEEIGPDGPPGQWPAKLPENEPPRVELPRVDTSSKAAADKALRTGAPVGKPRLNGIPTVGKVFFRNPLDNQTHACSASSLLSPSRLLVLTAGHCVHTGPQGGRPGRWVDSWLYIPAYYETSRPFGSWVARQLHALAGFTDNSELRWDVGMAAMIPLHGQRLTDVVGGLAFTWNRPIGLRVRAVSYAGNYGWGQTPYYCDGTTQWVPGDTRIQFDCDMQHGSSGGPWIYQYNDGRGFALGVLSSVYCCRKARSPYFNNSIDRKSVV